MNKKPTIPILKNELLSEVASEDIQQRLYLAEQFGQLPPEIFARLKHLQPQVGCFNRCAFCSQLAGRDVW